MGNLIKENAVSCQSAQECVDLLKKSRVMVPVPDGEKCRLVALKSYMFRYRNKIWTFKDGIGWYEIGGPGKQTDVHSNLMVQPLKLELL